MKSSLIQSAAQYAQKRRRKRLWYRTVSGLACVVVFCTVYALILPAITLEKEPSCGMEEHTHTEACYATEIVWPSTEYLCSEESLSGHVHDEDCYDEDGSLKCGYADFVLHTHDDMCYDRNGDLVCPLPEIEEHEHNRRCYRESEVLICGEEETGHIHDPNCFTSIRGDLICGQEEEEGHTHGRACYETEETLVCEQEEGEDHTHDEDCYETEEVLVCDLEESEGHCHSDDCYEWTEELICGREEDLEGHIHDEDCYTTVKELVCDEEEIIPHTHGERCFDTEDCPLCEEEDASEHTHPLICGKLQVLEHRHDETCAVEMEGEPEEVQVLICGLEEHTHSDTCYEEKNSTGSVDVPGGTGEQFCICELEEHTHGDECYDETGELICRLEEHTHSDACYEDMGFAGGIGSVNVPGGTGELLYICGLEEHIHDDACYDEAGELTCSLEEHTHDESCLAQVETPLRELSYTGGDYTVSVVFGEDAALPEGVKLSAAEIPSDSEEYQTYYRQTLETLAAQQTEGAEQLLFARFFDVQFLLDGQVLEPAAPVSVTITYNEPVETGDDVSCQAIHFTEDGPELLEAEAEEDPESGTTSFIHTQEGFSVVGSLVTRPLANAADIGPDSLPVDYSVCIDGQWTRVGATRTGWYAPADANGWTDYNRDYVTVDQAVSILGKYGFTGNETNPARKLAYQQKTGDVKLYSDTNTVEIGGNRVIPLARNTNGFNLYYLPANEQEFSSKTSPELLDKVANGFYTVTVSGPSGETLASEIVKTGGSFTYDASDSGVTSWLVAYDDGTIQTIEGSAIRLTDITSTANVSPYRGNADRHSVTFKVLLDGVWQEVGSLPYYYSGTVDGSQRAYITSDIAARFFGKFGYTAATEPGYQFGYSYNDIYEIVYCDANSKAPTDYCMDVAGASYANGSAIQLYLRNDSDAQRFRIRTAGDYGGEGYKYLTPLRDSSRQVNLSGSGETNGQKLVLWTSPTIHSSWKVVPEDGGLVSFQLRENTSYSIDVSGNNVGHVQLQIYQNAGAKFWKLIQHYCISNNTVSSQNTDGTWNIGLTEESNGDIICYYMPGETAYTYTDVAESELSTDDNGFYSVKVVDDSQGVYTVAQQAKMTQYVKSGSGTAVTVTVRNADGVLWTCRGMNDQPVEVTSTQEDGNTTFVITNITQPIEVTATRANPGFTVQYYAWMDVAANSGAVPLNIIDTSGGKLPGDYTSWLKKDEQTAPAPAALKQIYLNDNGTLSTASKLLEVYSHQDYRYEAAPGLTYVNKLAENSHYTLKEIWTLKPDRDPASTVADDWLVYPSTAVFVNSAPANPNEIMVTDTMVIRLVYQESEELYTNGVNFYDYDITNGSYETKYDSGHSMYYQVAQTSQYGINSAGNYSGSGTKLAFGNRNTGMSLQDLKWGQYYLNHYNASLPANDPGYGLNMDETRGYKGCTFGLVTSLEGGIIQYASGVDAPKLFNESGTVAGKTAFDNGEFSLQFDRVGDTYTLSAVNTAGGGTAAGNLDQFNHALGSNNFWPMDSASTWGASGHDLKFGDSAQQYARRYNTGSYYSSLPVSDDGQDHNSYFGMQYAVNFNLTSDYVGPLEYYFYGDDDMWVFLDNRLVCDIGGVHSTVGEYVNLWDYIEKGDAGQHTLTFFYTERGASGSTCYMRFTLPSVSSATTVRDIGELQISKAVAGTAAGLDDKVYEFEVELLTRENGTPLKEIFSYSCCDGTYGTVKSGGTIKLKSGQTALIGGLPAGTFYRVTELTTDGYTTTVNGDTGIIAAGTIKNGGTAPADFINTPIAYELPQTGGTGTSLYTLGGLCLMAGALLLLYRNKTRGKGGKEYPC